MERKVEELSMEVLLLFVVLQGNVLVLLDGREEGAGSEETISGVVEVGERHVDRMGWGSVGW